MTANSDKPPTCAERAAERICNEIHVPATDYPEPEDIKRATAIITEEMDKDTAELLEALEKMRAELESEIVSPMVDNRESPRKLGLWCSRCEDFITTDDTHSEDCPLYIARHKEKT